MFSGSIAVLSMATSVVVPPFAMMGVFSQLESEKAVASNLLAERIAWAVATGAVPLAVAAIPFQFAFPIWIWAGRKLNSPSSKSF
jgi:hypothetical protein